MFELWLGYQSYNSKKEDSGRLVLKKPMVCNECDKIVDVLIDIFSVNIEQKKRLKPFLNKCPECNSGNLKKWKNNTCPKCGSEMYCKEIIEYWD